MKQNYISGSKLSLWYKLVKRWTSLYRKVKTSKIKRTLTDSLKKLNGLSYILGIKRKIALTSLVGFVSLGAHAQINFVQVTDRANLSFKTAIKTNLYSDPAFADIDGDGDQDVLVGSSTDKVRFYRNDNGEYNTVSDVENPFINLVENGLQTPVFVDLDGDNDLDLVIANVSGNLNYYKNGNGVFEKQSVLLNPVSGINEGNNITPSFSDVDGDGDLDLVVGLKDGTLSYYEFDVPDVAVSGSTAKVFNKRTGTDNPFTLDVGGLASPFFVDLDGDNDSDLVIGNSAGTFIYLENDNAQYTKKTGSGNPLAGINTGGYLSSPNFADIDNDGDYDLVSGDYYGNLKYYTNSSLAFTEQTEFDNPFYGPEIGAFPRFADIDGDNDDDLVVGQLYTGIKYFERESTGYEEKKGVDNPFDAIRKTRNSPAFADLDGDNDLDLIISSFNNDVYYYKNLNSVFTEQINSANPFLLTGRDESPAFIDADGDGDLDLVKGDMDGVLSYSKNNHGVMTLIQAQIDNPFSSVIVTGGAPRPTAVDLDGDNDTDLVFTKPDGTVGYLQNDNNTFTEKLGVNNPFNDINADLLLRDGSVIFSVDFSDLDGDGDLDMIMGNRNGIHLEFMNVEIVNGLFSSTEKEKLKIYPNPASNIINIDEGNIEIFDRIGNLVLTQNSNGQVDVSVLDKGIYLVVQNSKRTKLVID